MTAVSFNILDWKAWSAGQTDAQPDVSVIPAMLRRRLSEVGRAAFSVIIPMIEAHGTMPLVYVSRHGDLGRTLRILEDIAQGELLSPAAFSLSVHNAIAGLFSIHRGMTSNITAISGGSSELVPALLETLALCRSHAGPVLCVFCDAPVPDIYQPHSSIPQQAYALALVVESGKDWQLTLLDSAVREDHQQQVQALTMLGLLQNNADGVFACNGGHWSVRRSSC